MTTTVIPTIAIHEIYTGGRFTGVESTGVATEETVYRGRIQKWLGSSTVTPLLGGEFSAPDNEGMRIEQVFWAMTCGATPDVSIFLVDDDDVEYLLDTQNAASGTYAQTNNGFLVPPTFKVRVKANQDISAVVAVVAENTGVLGDGVTAEYTVPFDFTRVDQTSVSLVAGAVTFTDAAGTGVLVGAGGGGGSGTIDYLTGIATITMTTPGDFSAVNALATYDYNNIGRVGIVVRQGWGQNSTSHTGIIGIEELPPTMQRI